MAMRFKKVIILGIDGLDPARVKHYAARGLMPNCRRLAVSGTFVSLTPGLPPMSPVAWSDMATGCDAGTHGIFDFIHRRQADYGPELAIRRARTGLLGTVYEPARRCDGFWRFVSDAGHHATVIRWPVTFPPEKVSGEMLSGLGVPDLLGGEGRDTLYAAEPPPAHRPELGPDHVCQVRWQDGVIRARIDGPRIGRNSFATQELLIQPLDANSAALHIGEQKAVPARLNEWTPYVQVEFRVGLRRLAALTRFLLVRTGDKFSLYQGPLQLDPERPAFPLSQPREFSAALAKAIGLFSTLGMPETVHPVTRGWFDRAALRKLCDAVDAERFRMLEFALGRFREGLLAFVFDTSDRVQHAFGDWAASGEANGDEPVAALYRRMDDAIGRVLEIVDDRTALWVVSDHGVEPFRRSFHLNRWLIREGYMRLKGDAGEGGLLGRDIDWTRTRAYALGFTSLYLNLKGREAEGIVQVGDEQVSLCRDIARRLNETRDPATGEPVIHRVYISAEIYRGPCVREGPDMIVGTRSGYRLSWQTALGGAPENLMDDNVDAWAFDHLFDPCYVPGVLLTNLRAPSCRPHAQDIAPSVLACLGVSIPSHLQGRPLV